MKTLDNATNKIQKICDQLRVETLEPAKVEAITIVEEARMRGEQIIATAKKEAEAHLNAARRLIEQERNVFESSLQQAGKQSLQALKQNIEKRLFNDQVTALLDKPLNDPQIVAKLLQAIIDGITKEGISVDLAVVLPKAISSDELAKHLAESSLKSISKNPIQIGGFGGGVQVRLVDKKITIDMTESTLRELLSEYVRKDFRKLLFAE